MTPQTKRHYSIRKVRASVGSVLIGTSLLFGLSAHSVQAETPTTEPSAGTTQQGTEQKKPESEIEFQADQVPAAAQTEDAKHEYKLYYQIEQIKTDAGGGQPETFNGTAGELKAKLEQVKKEYAQKGYPHSDQFLNGNNVLLIFYGYKNTIILKTTDKDGSQHSSVIYGDDNAKVEQKVSELTDGLKKTYETHTVERLEKKGDRERTITLTFRPKSEETPKVDPKAPEKAPETGKTPEAGQTENLNKDYKLFYQIEAERSPEKVKSEDFRGNEEALNAKLKAVREEYTRNGYPHSDQFINGNSILLIFYSYKNTITVETTGDNGSKHSSVIYGNDKAKVEKKVADLIAGLETDYEVKRSEKTEENQRTITLTLTPKSEETPKVPESEKTPDMPKQPDTSKTPDESKKSEESKKPESEKMSKDEKAPKVEGMSNMPKSDTKQVEPSKPMPLKAQTAKKVLPNTGDASSALTLLGSGLLGFLGVAYTRKRKK